MACIRSWGRAGMSPGLISIQGPGEPKPVSKYLTGAVCLSRQDLYSERGLETIIRFLADFGASGLTCIDENIARWLNDQRPRLPEGITLWLPPSGMLRRVLDKGAQIDAARQVGLNVLPTYLFSRGDFTDEIPSAHFPLCLRPSAPGSVDPLFKVENVESVTELRKFLGGFNIYSSIIGQPFKNLPNLVVHGTRMADGTTVGMEGFLVERKFQGVTLTLRPISLSAELKARCVAFTEAMELIGHYHFEFLFDELTGESHFLEINHRFGGTTAKVLVCGYLEPLYALQAQGIEMPVNASVNNHTVSSLKALGKSAFYALADRLTPLDYPEESKAKRLWSTVKCMVACKDEVFAWDDLPGTAAFYLGDLPGRMTGVVAACRKLLTSARGKPGRPESE
ncbi:hypothetical protein [Trichloromonas sp.]|uniref:hypothetical protein n=1 Tax=Trichloromonas sp. TaxID=3069249 RepID=UPI003D8164B7